MSSSAILDLRNVAMCHLSNVQSRKLKNFRLIILYVVTVLNMIFITF